MNGGEWWLRLTTPLTSVSRTLHAVVQVDHIIFRARIGYTTMKLVREPEHAQHMNVHIQHPPTYDILVVVC